MRSQQLITPRPRLVYSDVRLKREVLLLETLGNGINLYRYQYRWSGTEYVGVMAQEVAAVVPEAVSTDADGSTVSITDAWGYSYAPTRTG